MTRNEVTGLATRSRYSGGTAGHRGIRGDIHIVAVVIMVLAMMSGCINPFVGDSDERGSGGPHGTLEIRVGTPGVSGSTISPDIAAAISAIDRYTITLSRDGFDSLTGTVPRPATGAPQMNFSDVPLGTWTVAVDALNSEGATIARGKTTASVSSGGSTASVTLDLLIAEGTGDLGITITFPTNKEVSTVDATLTSKDGTSETLPMNVDITTGSAGWNGSREAGSYTLTAHLKNEAGATIATVVEAVNVYGNLDSNGTVNLEANQISSAPSEPRSISATQRCAGVDIRWEDGGPIETGYQLQRSGDGGNTWSDLANLGANIVAYTDTTVEVGRGYRYRVRGENAFGSSRWSEQREDTTVMSLVTAGNDGPFTVQQGGRAEISLAKLLENDDTREGEPGFDSIVPGSETGVTVTRSGDTLIVTSTGIAYETASFRYRVTGDTCTGTTATGTVTLYVTPMPAGSAYVYTERNALEDKMNSYTPPTQEEIFNNWGRFDGNTVYTNANSASGNADDWEFLTGPDRVSMPLNVDPYNGFFSTEKLENYTFAATLHSPDQDNDTISLIMAYTEVNGTPYVLSAGRSTGGSAPQDGWGVLYGTADGSVDYQDSGVDWVVASSTAGQKQDGSGGWAGGYTRVRIVRNGDTITAWTTDWYSTREGARSAGYPAASMIEIDLNSDNRLAKFKGPASYGYGSFSQPYSTYYDIEIDGGLAADTLILLTGGFDSDHNGTVDRWSESEVWKYNGTWAKQTGRSIQDELGFVREVIHPDTGTTFLIREYWTGLAEQ
ncbi:MAG: hypothetical protein ACOCYQ_03520 [Alkalispirochaeta sp.]